MVVKHYFIAIMMTYVNHLNDYSFCLYSVLSLKIFLFFLEVESRSDRRDCLRLLCMLLPQANRDTLQQLLCFLDQVTMYSSEIILIDGTESMGNRMTEENLALIFGPNILHKVKFVFVVARGFW